MENYFATQTGATETDDLLDTEEDQPESSANQPLLGNMADNQDQPPAQGVGAGVGAGGAGSARTLGGAAVDDRLPAGWGQPEPSRLGRVGQASGGQAARRPGE